MVTGMKTINVVFTEKEWKIVRKRKGLGISWHHYILKISKIAEKEVKDGK